MDSFSEKLRNVYPSNQLCTEKLSDHCTSFVAMRRSLHNVTDMQKARLRTKQCCAIKKIKPVARSIVELCLAEGISQSASQLVS